MGGPLIGMPPIPLQLIPEGQVAHLSPSLQAFAPSDRVKDDTQGAQIFPAPVVCLSVPPIHSINA